MPSEIIVPVMGESVVEATIARWLKKEGEPVSLGEPLVELETEKVNQEIAAGDSGVLEKILHREGATVKIGDVLGVIAAGEGTAASAAPPAKDTAASPNGGPPPPVATPSTPAPLAAAETSPAAVAPSADIRATPLAHRVAEDLSVPLQEVPASGPGGKVQRADVEAFAAQPTPGAAATPTVEAAANVASPVQQQAPPAAQTAPSAADARGETRQRLSRRRLTIARRLVEAQQTAAMLTTFNEVDMTAVMALRKKHRDAFKERHGVGLGFMSFFTKACVAALKAFPQVNAEMQGEEIVFRHYHDVGIAVGDKEGLVVPVIRSAESLSFAEIEKKITEFAEKVKTKGMTLDDLRGGTFTITNGGVFGSLVSTPILNGTQVGILGMHKIQERPIAIDGEVVIRPMMYLALTYDHRVVDGREAVQFLVRVKELLEDPERLLLDG